MPKQRLSGPLAHDVAVRLLTEGSLQLEGRLRGASNTTLRAIVTLDGVSARCVYKPISGERPLWDFPDGTLAAREVAAFLVSEQTGWGIVPPTVLRDGPLGEGACQLWVDESRARSAARVAYLAADAVPDGWHPIIALEDDEGGEFILAHADDPALARIALLDVVINNADRKGGHVLHGRDGSLRGVDHGVTFHVEDKLRTVLWGFMGHPIDANDIDTLRSLRAMFDGPLCAQLSALLEPEEVAATLIRLDSLIAAQVFPGPRPGRHALPWPPI